MSGGAVVEVEGARQLRATLKKAGRDVQELAKVNATVSKYVALRGAAMAPRRTGRLAGSVRGNSAKTNATVRAGGASLRYAGPIHWGWPARHIVAQPFLSQAATTTESVWTGFYMRKIDEVLATVKGV